MLCFMASIRVIALVALAVASATATLPPKAAILRDARKAFDYYTDSIGRNHTSCDWLYGTFMTGVAALHRATGDPSLREYMRSFGERYHWDFCNSDAGNPDNQVRRLRAPTRRRC